MGVLARLNTTAFSVPLLLSSLLLRVLAATQGKRKRSTLLAGRRVPPPAPLPGAGVRVSAALPKNHPRADVKAMRHELTAVLDAHEGSREVFRYLAHFERRLAKNGLDTLELISVKRLRRALAQFEAIVTNWSQPNLAELRSRMAVTVSLRSSAGALWMPAATISKAYGPREMPMLTQRRRSAAPGPTDSDGNPQVEVDEDVNISRFEAAASEWHLSQRQALLAAGQKDLAHR